MSSTDAPAGVAPVEAVIKSPVASPDMSANDKLVSTTLITSCMTDKKEVIRVKDSDTLLKAFHKLQKNNILAVPVYDEKKKRFYGFLDVLDIISFVLKIDSAYKHNRKTTWADFLATEELFASATCGSVKNLSHLDLYTQVMPSATINTALSLVSAFPGLHRLAIVGPYPNYDLVGIVSQSDVLRYLYKHLDHNEAVFSKTIGDLKIGQRPVICIGDDKYVGDAFRLLKKHKVSGIAVLNKDEQLVGNISASDIKSDKEFSIDSIVDLCHRKTGELVKEAEKRAIEAGKIYPITATANNTLLDVMKLFVHRHVHRVYLVDGNGKLAGVISLGDILTVFHKPGEYVGY